MGYERLEVVEEGQVWRLMYPQLWPNLIHLSMRFMWFICPCHALPPTRCARCITESQRHRNDKSFQSKT